METVIYILRSFVLLLLDILQFALLGRAIMSWFDQGGEGTISSFLTFVTEPFIIPIRRLCERMHWFEGSMLDIPFFLTMIILTLLQTILTVA